VRRMRSEFESHSAAGAEHCDAHGRGAATGAHQQDSGVSRHRGASSVQAVSEERWCMEACTGDR
jgi:hypothetical protein